MSCLPGMFLLSIKNNKIVCSSVRRRVGQHETIVVSTTSRFTLNHIRSTAEGFFLPNKLGGPEQSG